MTTNKDLLYSTGNSIQYSVMAYMGNESKRVDICICIGEGNGTHSSTLAWKIPWMEGTGGLQSMESLGVRHD